MIRGAFLLWLLLCVLTVSAVEITHGYTVTLTAKEAADCEEEGGCVFISKAKAIEMMQKEAKRIAGNCMGGA